MDDLDSPDRPRKDPRAPARNDPRVKSFFAISLLLLTSLAGFEDSPPPQPTTPAADHWAFHPPRRDGRSLDQLIAANLEKAGFTANPRASREILIERAHHVLTGLLPTSAERERLLADEGPDWFAHLVDELLSRPGFGERWARHWLDVARYADTRGAALPRNEDFPFAWTYRDWVIDAFNKDLPYDQFLHRQIAADLLDLPREELAALGFLTVGRGYQGGQNHLVIADRIDVSTRATMGLTVACARCHDHKTDPIPTADYYALYGVFNSSFVPPQLPVIGEPAQTPAAKAYRAELERKALAVHEHVANASEGYQRPDDLFNFTLPRKIRDQFNQMEREKFRTLVGQIESFRASSPHARPRAMILQEKAQPDQPRIHERGNPRALGDPVPRAFLSLFREEDEHFTEGSGRLEFARRLTDERNPLTARVWANRVWMHLTGSPLVDSPGDFGPQTPPPLQLALLDHLALYLQDHQWSTKALIRHIMTSDTWQRGSGETPELRERDPANHYYARANRRRKDLEAWRDSILQVSGRLDRHRGGPPFLIDHSPYEGRRTIYAKVRRGFLPAIMRAFDFPGSEEPLMRRPKTITPTQALYLMNSPFLHGEARAIAGEHQGVGAIYRAILGRDPTPDERARATAWLSRADRGRTSGMWDYGFTGRDSLNFHPLPHFADGQWRGQSPLPDPIHGWLHWTRQGGHPEIDRHAVLKWTALESGTVKIGGEVTMPQSKGNGVIARLISPDGEVYGEWTVDPGQSAEAKVPALSVQEGEELWFLVDCRGEVSFDSFRWAPVISDDEGVLADAAADFAGPGLSPPAQLAQALLLSNEFFYLD